MVRDVGLPALVLPVLLGSAVLALAWALVSTRTAFAILRASHGRAAYVVPSAAAVLSMAVAPASVAERLMLGFVVALGVAALQVSLSSWMRRGRDVTGPRADSRSP